MTLDLGQLMDRSEEIWEGSILPSLSDFIEIKALSPLFEPDLSLIHISEPTRPY